MTIVKIQGGLGNQMFQYAFAKNLEKKGFDVFLDTSLYKKGLSRGGINYTHNGFELERLFSISYKEASVQQTKKLATLPTSIFMRFRRKYITKKTHYIDKVFKYTPKIYDTTDDIYLEGYWQTEKYFSDIENEIRSTFSFTKPISEKSQSTVEQIQSNTAASIHVRRGDYLQGGIHDVCTKTYYNNAISHAIASAKIQVFFVFSNDIEWAKENLNFNTIPAVYVDWNTGKDSWQDMYIMSQCSVNIIANSSFSWWAAWLNANKDKKIIAPSIWNRRELDFKDNYYTFDYSDVVPDSWERISI